MVSPNTRTINVSEDLYNKIYNISGRSGVTLLEVVNTVLNSGLKTSPNGKNETHSQVLRWSRYFNSKD